MTLWETGESDGNVSLMRLFNESNYSPIANNKKRLEDLFYIICRGGWPRCLLIEDKKGKLEIAKDYFRQIYTKDIISFDKVKRDPKIAKTLIKSYARNVATLATKKVIYKDVQSTQSASRSTLDDYVSVLEGLFVIRDIDAWRPQIRSKTAIRASKRGFLSILPLLQQLWEFLQNIL